MLKMIMLAVASVVISQSAIAQQHQYKVRIDQDRRLALVEASIALEGNTLTLFNTNPLPNHPNGQADFLKNIRVFDSNGNAIKIEDKGEGEYELVGNRSIRLSYELSLEHDQIQWPAGNEEVLYHTNEGLMLSGYTLFLVPGEKMSGETLVEFQLPQNWQSHAALKPFAKKNQFIAKSRRELVNNAYFFGTAGSSKLQAGGLEIELVLGKRYFKQRKIIEDLLQTQLTQYLEIFGAKPQAERYLIIINQGDSGDGGAFSGSFSQFLRGDAELRTRHIWGRVLAHELLHFWNGLSLIPESDKDEWFKEGVTDYLTIKTMAQNGLISRQYLQQWLENLSRGQLVARRAQNIQGTVQEAAQNKHQNWLLVYGGGSIAGFAIDVELRKRSSNKLGIEDLMKALYKNFAAKRKPFNLEDVVTTANQLSSSDLAPLFRNLVQSKTPVDLAPVFNDVGMQLEQYLLLEHHLLAKPNMKSEEKERFKAMFGTQLFPLQND